MKKVRFQANLPVTFMREGDQFVAYTPALDLSTAGNTFVQVKKRFAEAVHILIEECLKMGTLTMVLEDLGWVKRKSEWVPPIIVAQESQILNIPVIA